MPSSKSKNGRVTAKKPKEKSEVANEQPQGPNVPVEYLIKNYREKLARSEAEAAEWQAIADVYKDQLEANTNELKKLREEVDILIGEKDGKENGKSDNKQSRKVRQSR